MVHYLFFVQMLGAGLATTWMPFFRLGIGIIFIIYDPHTNIEYVTLNWQEVLNNTWRDTEFIIPQNYDKLYENSSKIPLQELEYLKQNHHFKFQIAYLENDGIWNLEDEKLCACQLPPERIIEGSNYEELQLQAYEEKKESPV